MTDKTQPTGAGVPAAQLDAILLAMHLRQRAKLTATGNADALSQNAANVLVAQYDRIAELKAEGSRLQNGLEAQRMLTDRAISVAKDLDAQAAAKCLHQGADAGAVAALKGLLSLVRREAPQLSGKVLGDAESAIAALQAAPPAPAFATLPEGWTACRIEHEPGYPEDVAFGPQIMMDRLKKWLDRHFAALAAAPAQAWPSECDSPELCRVHRGCAGQYGTKKTCHSFAVLNPCNPAAPAQAVARIDSPVRPDGSLWRAEVTLTQPLAQFSDLYAAPAQEHATQLAGQATTRRQWTDGTRTLKQDVLGAIHDYSRTKPEEDPEDPESWESWFEAAFDLLGSRVGDIFDEHAAPAQAQEDARDALTLVELDQLDRAIEHFVEGEDTDVDWRLLTRAACLGFLECERFTVPPTARAAIDAARAAQGGAT